MGIYGYFWKGSQSLAGLWVLVLVMVIHKSRLQMNHWGQGGFPEMNAQALLLSLPTSVGSVGRDCCVPSELCLLPRALPTPRMLPTEPLTAGQTAMQSGSHKGHPSHQKQKTMAKWLHLCRVIVLMSCLPCAWKLDR